MEVKISKTLCSRPVSKCKWDNKRRKLYAGSVPEKKECVNPEPLASWKDWLWLHRLMPFCSQGWSSLRKQVLGGLLPRRSASVPLSITVTHPRWFLSASITTFTNSKMVLLGSPQTSLFWAVRFGIQIGCLQFRWKNYWEEWICSRQPQRSPVQPHETQASVSK